MNETRFSPTGSDPNGSTEIFGACSETVGVAARRNRRPPAEFRAFSPRTVTRYGVRRSDVVNWEHRPEQPIRSSHCGG